MVGQKDSEALVSFLLASGYLDVRIVDGQVIALMPLTFGRAGIVAGVSRYSYQTRW